MFRVCWRAVSFVGRLTVLVCGGCAQDDWVIAASWKVRKGAGGDSLKAFAVNCRGNNGNRYWNPQGFSRCESGTQTRKL